MLQKTDTDGRNAGRAVRYHGRIAFTGYERELLDAIAKSAVSSTVSRMASPTPQKLYAYVDESGQDTAGRLFVVSVLLLAEERDALLPRLEGIETRSGK